ncbi:unnamed protein product [Prorocentrum cordatum]|uniref:Uncharacterized protein n=1 Tax=Prorocentrum cordatum TaxID=2364126 RepID=A0ABN9VTL5_9DINO|nr:unnamed protein product [Polarella glacialis]
MPLPEPPPRALEEAEDLRATLGGRPPRVEVVAGGLGRGGQPNQLYRPIGLAVDGEGGVVIADNGNDRVVRWLPGSSKGELVAGGGGELDGPGFDDPIGVVIPAGGGVLITGGGGLWHAGTSAAPELLSCGASPEWFTPPSCSAQVASGVSPLAAPSAGGPTDRPPAAAVGSAARRPASRPTGRPPPLAAAATGRGACVDRPLPRSVAVSRSPPTADGRFFSVISSAFAPDPSSMKASEARFPDQRRSAHAGPPLPRWAVLRSASPPAASPGVAAAAAQDTRGGPSAVRAHARLLRRAPAARGAVVRGEHAGLGRGAAPGLLWWRGKLALGDVPASGRHADFPTVGKLARWLANQERSARLRRPSCSSGGGRPSRCSVLWRPPRRSALGPGGAGGPRWPPTSPRWSSWRRVTSRPRARPPSSLAGSTPWPTRRARGPASSSPAAKASSGACWTRRRPPPWRGRSRRRAPRGRPAARQSPGGLSPERPTRARFWLTPPSPTLWTAGPTTGCRYDRRAWRAPCARQEGPAPMQEIRADPRGSLFLVSCL